MELGSMTDKDKDTPPAPKADPDRGTPEAEQEKAAEKRRNPETAKVGETQEWPVGEEGSPTWEGGHPGDGLPTDPDRPDVDETYWPDTVNPQANPQETATTSGNADKRDDRRDERKDERRDDKRDSADPLKVINEAKEKDHGTGKPNPRQG